ncbi:MAG: YceH family protein [Thermoanaerobaculia bacterium]|nr:YceH family protein [Thermoanaerobaculia bacterium]
MRSIADLNPTQVRILGALLEKEQTTPDYYPPTVNALLAACNQKSNRDPVVQLRESILLEELETLRQDVLVWRSDGARVARWSESISRRLKLTAEERALLTVLMLRGPQTLGELRTRTQRLHPFTELDEVEATLQRMATPERDLVVELPREPGQKENRWLQRLGGEESPTRPAKERPQDSPEPISPLNEPSAHPAFHGHRPDVSGDDFAARIARLESEVSELKGLVQRLVEELGG